MVAIHDLDLTLRFAHAAVAFKAGRVLAAGPAEAVLCEDTLGRLFDVRVRVTRDAEGGSVRFLD